MLSINMINILKATVLVLSLLKTSTTALPIYPRKAHPFDGSLTLINSTPYDWFLTRTTQYQNYELSFNAPSTIPAGTTGTIPFHTEQNQYDWFKTVYDFGGTSDSGDAGSDGRGQFRILASMHGSKHGVQTGVHFKKTLAAAPAVFANSGVWWTRATGNRKKKAAGSGYDWVWQDAVFELKGEVPPATNGAVVAEDKKPFEMVFLPRLDSSAPDGGQDKITKKMVPRVVFCDTDDLELDACLKTPSKHGAKVSPYEKNGMNGEGKEIDQ